MDWTVKTVSILVVALISLWIGKLAVSDPASVQGVSLALFWGLVFALVLYHSGRRSFGEKRLSRVFVLGLLLRVPIVFAHLAVGFLFYRGAVDFPGYFSNTVAIGRDLLSGSWERIFGFESGYLAPASGVEVVNGLMAFGYLMVGPSIVGLFFLSGMVGLMGSYLFLRAFQVQFPSYRDYQFPAICLFLFPSLAFWTSLLGKDPWMFFSLGCATYSVSRLTKSFRPRHLLMFIVSVALVYLIRPPIGVALAAAFFSSLILLLPSRLPRKGPAAILRPVGYLFFSIAVVGFLAVLISPLRRYIGSPGDTPLVKEFVRFAVEKHVGLSTDPSAGGSSMEVAIREPTLSASFHYLPIGMFSFLFRPLLYEAHNILALAAALDGTLLLILLIWRWRCLLAAIRSGLSSPFVAFCGVAFLLFTAGLSFESNLGVIVRHRSMVLPFLFLLLSISPKRRDQGETPRGLQNVTGREVSLNEQ